MQTELLHSTGQQNDQYILICDADQETVRTILIWIFCHACHETGRYFVMQDRLVDIPADVHVMDKLSWIRLGSHPLKPTTVKLRGASGADLHAFGTCQVRGTSGKQPRALEVMTRSSPLTSCLGVKRIDLIT